MTLRIEGSSGIVQEIQNGPANPFLLVPESQGCVSASPQFSEVTSVDVGLQPKTGY